VLPVCDVTAGQTVGVATLWLPSAVAALVELVERVWSEATPVGPVGDQRRHNPGPRERDLLALLVAVRPMNRRRTGLVFRYVRYGGWFPI